MSLKMETTLAKLIAKESDTCGYVTYVFKILDKSERNRLNSKYLMCVRFPNWEHRTLSLGEVGYLSYKVIIAGVDQWFDGNALKYYRYSMVQFIKFVSKPVSKKHSYTL